MAPPQASAGNSKASHDKVKVKLSFAEDFVLSGIAAVTSKTISAPIERIKMVIQNQGEMIKQGVLDGQFKGIVDCARWIQRNEGVSAFWKSNFTNCVRYFPTQALNFAFKGQIKKIDQLKVKKEDSFATKLPKNIMGGGLAGGGSLCFVYSLNFARTRLATDLKSTKDGGKRKFNGLVDVYTKTWKSEGIRGLYRGFCVSFVGIFVYRGFYFGLYDTVIPLVPESSGLFVRFCVGYVTTVLAGLASYPIDTVRRRMMMTSGTGKNYKNSLDCAKFILNQEGFGAFFKGAGANILRSVAGAGVLAGFDIIKKFYVKKAYGPECYC